MFKVLITGGREYSNRKYVFEYLDEFHKATPISLLIHGGATGADYLAGEWAKSREIPFKVYPAEWKKYGKRAGPIRNQQMLDEESPEFVIAFPGNSGTKDMINKAEKAKITVFKPNEK